VTDLSWLPCPADVAEVLARALSPARERGLGNPVGGVFTIDGHWGLLFEDGARVLAINGEPRWDAEKENTQ
jgi:hypothetical protein